VLLKFDLIRQHRRRQDGRVGPDDGGIDRIGRAGDDEANVVSGSAKDGGHTLATNALQPMLVDLKSKYFEETCDKLVRFENNFRAQCNNTYLSVNYGFSY